MFPSVQDDSGFQVIWITSRKLFHISLRNICLDISWGWTKCTVNKLDKKLEFALLFIWTLFGTLRNNFSFWYIIGLYWRHSSFPMNLEVLKCWFPLFFFIFVCFLKGWKQYWLYSLVIYLIDWNAQKWKLLDEFLQTSCSSFCEGNYLKMR